MATRHARRLIQFAVAATALAAGIGLSMGWSMSGIEKYCPFGGIETGYSLIMRQQFSCATGEYNLSLMLALLLLTALARKSFCSWICPVGTVCEWLAFLGRKLKPRGRPKNARLRPGLYSPPSGPDRILRLLRPVVLVLILFFTWRSGELVFRAYDPYYVLFSAGGHDVRWWSYITLASILAAAVLIPMAWCRYICPLGCVLWPLAKLSPLRISRSQTACKSCGTCDAVCPHSIPVSTVTDVRSGECTLCMECTEACTADGALQLRLSAGRLRKIPEWMVPALLVVITAIGLTGGSLIALPSFKKDFGYAAAGPDEAEKVVLTIDGLRCVDTASSVASQLDGLPGVIGFTAFASRHRAEILFDENRIDVTALRRSIEGPVYDEKSDQYLFHRFTVVEIDGKKPEK